MLNNLEDNDSVIHHVKLDKIEQLKEKQIITAGMIPKIDNISYALKNGVEKVILCNAQNIGSIINENSTFGTLFTIN